MQEFQQRVIQEKAELEDKLKKLEAFFSTDTFDGLDAREQELLDTQYGIMGLYSDVLGTRIARFTEISEAPYGQTNPR